MDIHSGLSAHYGKARRSELKDFMGRVVVEASDIADALYGVEEMLWFPENLRHGDDWSQDGDAEFAMSFRLTSDNANENIANDVLHVALFGPSLTLSASNNSKKVAVRNSHLVLKAEGNILKPQFDSPPGVFSSRAGLVLCSFFMEHIDEIKDCLGKQLGRFYYQVEESLDISHDSELDALLAEDDLI